MGPSFPTLAHHFHCQIRPYKLHPVPACIYPTCVRDFAMHCFDSKLAFDLFSANAKLQTAIASDQRRPSENSERLNLF
jgi:hypothetical protein